MFHSNFVVGKHIVSVYVIKTVRDSERLNSKTETNKSMNMYDIIILIINSFAHTLLTEKIERK